MSLKADDLKNTILPKISIDQFHPKAGTEEDGTVEAGTVESGTDEAGTDEDGTVEAGTVLDSVFQQFSHSQRFARVQNRSIESVLDFH